MDDNSDLLINKDALPDGKLSGFQATADMMIMAFLSATNRALKRFKLLLVESDFEMTGVWLLK